MTEEIEKTEEIETEEFELLTPTEKVEIKDWFKAAAVRAIKSAAQSGIAAIGVSSIDVIHTDWLGILSIAVGGAILSILTSIAGIPEVADGKNVLEIQKGATND